jgi:CDP-diacylglycerol--serine O-phosphatidyltransferase
MVFVTTLDFEMAFLFCVFGYLLDFLMVLLLKVSGPLGLELDSLADMVTSGVVPGYVMFFMLSNSQHEISTHFMLPYLDLSRWVLVTVWLYSTSIPVRRIHSLV